MEIVRIYALHSHSVAAAGSHLNVASAKGQSITHFQHVLLTSRFVRVVDLIYVIISSGMSGMVNLGKGVYRGG